MEMEEATCEHSGAPSVQLLSELRAPGSERSGADVTHVTWAEAGGAFLLAAASGGTLAVFSLQRCGNLGRQDPQAPLVLR